MPVSLVVVHRRGRWGSASCSLKVREAAEIVVWIGIVGQAQDHVLHVRSSFTWRTVTGPSFLSGAVGASDPPTGLRCPYPSIWSTATRFSWCPGLIDRIRQGTYTVPFGLVYLSG